MYFIILLVFLYFLMRKFYDDKYNYWRYLNIPHLKPSAPFGNLENFFKGRCNPVGIQLGRMYKDLKNNGHLFGGVYLMHSPAFIPVDINLVREILTESFDYFDQKKFFMNETDQPLSANILYAGGEKWYNMRKKMGQNFASAKIKPMLPSVLKCRASLLSFLEDTFYEKKRLDIKELATKFTTDVIGSVAFGVDCDSFANPNNEMRIIAKKLFHESNLQFVKNMFAANFHGLARNLHLCPFAYDVEKLIKDRISEAILHRNQMNLNKHDFLQMLMKLHSNQSITYDELIAQSFVIFLAGYENASSALIFCLYELAQHLEEQQTVRDEIRWMMSAYGGSITYDGLMELSYMDQVIAEVLRMHPPNMVVERVCSKTYKLPKKDLVIPSGTTVVIAIHGIHHDPQYFPDPEVFNPNRFSDENIDYIMPFTYLPFGEGPRTCLGQKFVIMIIKVALISLLENYEYKLSGKKRIGLTYEMKSILTPSDKILLHLDQVA